MNNDILHGTAGNHVLLHKKVTDVFVGKAEVVLKQCRPGDLEHAQRVAHWVEELGGDRQDWERLIKAAIVHDMGWHQVAFQEKLTKAELNKLEPQANLKSEPIIRRFLTEQGESESEIVEILRLVQAADKHRSTTVDEAIIVDADNLSKLSVDHIRDKYQKSDWLEMMKLWEEEFSKRIQTEKGKSLYPKLLKQLRNEVERLLL